MKWPIKEFFSSFVDSQLCKEISLDWRQKGETFHPVQSISSYKLYLGSASQTDNFESAKRNMLRSGGKRLTPPCDMHTRRLILQVHTAKRIKKITNLCWKGTILFYRYGRLAPHPIVNKKLSKWQFSIENCKKCVNCRTSVKYTI